MHQDPTVALARWECPQQAPTATAVEHGVSEFARRHGIGNADRALLGAAVAEAVANALDVPGATVVVDAATDGACVSVRVHADRRPHVTDGAAALTLGHALATRVEYGPALTGPGWSVLLEFAMRSQRAPWPAGSGLPPRRRERCAGRPATGRRSRDAGHPR